MVCQGNTRLLLLLEWGYKTEGKSPTYMYISIHVHVRIYNMCIYSHRPHACTCIHVHHVSGWLSVFLRGFTSLIS